MGHVVIHRRRVPRPVVDLGARARSVAMGVVLALAVTATGTATGPAAPIVIDDFERGRSERWEERRFQGQTEYTVIADDDGRVLRAESRNAASGLVYELKFDPRVHQVLTWRWKVENLVKGSDPTRKAGDDYPARVYVVFPHWFPPRTKSLNYIWATDFPEGEHIRNPFFGNAVMIAVQSGGQNVGRWVTERRNLVDDYRMVFGEDPPQAGAVAIMTDTDQTGETAVAYYDDIRLEP